MALLVAAAHDKHLFSEVHLHRALCIDVRRYMLCCNLSSCQNASNCKYMKFIYDTSCSAQQYCTLTSCACYCKQHGFHWDHILYQPVSQGHDLSRAAAAVCGCSESNEDCISLQSAVSDRAAVVEGAHLLGASCMDLCQMMLLSPQKLHL
jgi:hypothetical protein